MSLSDKLGFIVNETLETMGSIADEIFARMTNKEFSFNKTNKDAKAEIGRMKEAQAWLGTQVEELQKKREQLGFIGQTYLVTLPSEHRYVLQAMLDNIVPAMDEHIEMAQGLYSANKQHVNRMEDNVSKVATGRFRWLSDGEKPDEDQDLIEVPSDSMFAPKPPVEGVIDVDSVREQLADSSIGLCTTDDSRSFTVTTMFDGIDLIGRMADALVSKDAELAKIKRAIRKLQAVLDRSVDLVTGDIRKAKKELTGIDELDARVHQVTEQMRKEHVENERFRKASASATALSRDELVRQNAHSKVEIEDFRKKVNQLEARIHDNNDAIKCLSNFVADLTIAQNDLQEANRTLKSQLDKAIDEVKTRSDQLDMVRDELDEKRAKLAAVGDVDELQMRLDNASKQLIDKTEEAERLFQARTQLSAQCDGYKHAAEENERAIASLKGKLDEATKQAGQRARELAVFQENASRTKKQMESELAKQSELQTKLKKSNQERASLERRLSELRTTNSRLERQLKELQIQPRTEHERMKTELDAVQAQLAEAQSFLRSREDTINRLQHESEEIFERKLEAVQRVAQLESGLKDAEETVALLTEQVHALNVAYVEKRRLEAVVEELRRDMSLQNVRRNEMNQSLLTQLRDAVYPTLCGRYTEGYSSIRHLLDDLREDTGRDGERDARALGFSSFTEFLQSNEMSDRVIVETVYKARTNPTVAHLHREQEISASHKRAQIMKEVNKRVGAIKCENERLRIELRVRDEKVVELTTKINELNAES
ncbi:hypothetical protein AAVH_12967 [Aphelenchoides avenae]|nr:hypothetical protein AAVH_12967 [Aphelenchus avenae]